MMAGYASLIAFIVTTDITLCTTLIAEGWLNEKGTMAFPRISAIILAGISVQHVIGDMSIITLKRL